MVYLLSSMNRGELVQSLVEETGLPKNVVRAVVNALPTVVAKGIREGESISMKGFGSFVPWQQSERLARNPKTGGSNDYSTCLGQIQSRERFT